MAPKVLTAAEASYLLAVTDVATWGFTTESTAVILAAVALALPTGLVALVAYYLLYGLLAQVPGANPDTVTGWASCSSDGVCRSQETGGLAPWFALSADILGILLLVAAAVPNIMLVRQLTAWRREKRQTEAPPTA